MKKYTELLDDFMQAKNDLLEDKIQFEGYYLEEDRKDIFDIDEVEAERIYKEIQTLAFNGSLEYPTSCVFCMINEMRPYGISDCGICTYGKRHGECNDGDQESTWLRLFLEVERIGVSIEDIFTPDWFINYFRGVNDNETTHKTIKN